MRVHDTELLVSRAQEHRRVEGRIERGTYGYTTEKEDKRGDGFRGCAIACLSTPAIPVEMTKFLDELRGKVSYPEGAAFSLESAGLRAEEQVEKIERQFGIYGLVTRIGEDAFEHSFLGVEGAHDRAADFVLAFAEAFHEGAEFDFEYARKFQYGQAGIAPSDTQYADNVLTWIDGTKPPGRMRTMVQRLDALRVPALTGAGFRS